MGAIDNTNLTNYLESNGTEDFSPAVNYTYDAAAQEVDVQDVSSFPSGVSLEKAHIKVHDKFGNEANGYILAPGDSDSAHASDTTIDVSGLDASKGLIITATVIGSDHKLVADGSAHDIGAAGSIGSWDKQKNA